MKQILEWVMLILLYFVFGGYFVLMLSFIPMHPPYSDGGIFHIIAVIFAMPPAMLFGVLFGLFHNADLLPKKMYSGGRRY